MRQLYIHPGKKYRLPRKIKKQFKKHYTLHIIMVWESFGMPKNNAVKFAKQIMKPLPKWMVEPPKFEMSMHLKPLEWEPIEPKYDFMNFLVPPDLEYRGNAFMGLVALP